MCQIAVIASINNLNEFEPPAISSGWENALHRYYFNIGQIGLSGSPYLTTAKDVIACFYLWQLKKASDLHLEVIGILIYKSFQHGRLARWRKGRACDIGEAKEVLENEPRRRWSNGRIC